MTTKITLMDALKRSIANEQACFKNCPFCGSDDLRAGLSVICQGCGARANVNAWNKRAHRRLSLLSPQDRSAAK